MGNFESWMLGLLGAGVNTRRIKPRSRVTRMAWPVTVTSSRKTRNPADPAQAYLIARADAKRARRAQRNRWDAQMSYVHNPCPAVNPFYITQ